MPNSWFQFKQFTIQQEKSAMKVTTDACLFGAVVAIQIKNSKLKIKSVLDIGTGTGLLSLMLAQEVDAHIDAVEIDEAAFMQAKENASNSPWKERINIFNTDVKNYQPGKKYDFIIVNPPFFEADLKSGDKKKNAAKHDTALTLEKLLKAVDDNLPDEGNVAVLLPWHRIKYFEEEALSINFHLHKKIFIKQTPQHNYFRGILFFSRTKTELLQSEIIIKNEEGIYTPEFTALLKDYYLHF